MFFNSPFCMSHILDDSPEEPKLGLPAPVITKLSFSK